MGALDKLKAARQQTSSLPPTSTFPVHVTGYDLKSQPNLLIGQRLDTGEQVKVFMRPDPYAEQRSKQRAEIADFAAPPFDAVKREANKSATELGGVIRVDRAFLDKNTGFWNAGWMKPLSHTPSEAQIKVVQARINKPAKNEASGREFFSVDMLETNKARSVSSAKELNDALTAGFAVATGGSPLVAIRVKDSDGEHFEHIQLTAMVKPEGGYAYPAPPEASAERFLKTETGTALLEVAGQEGVTIEVIPGSRTFPGKDTLANLIKNEKLAEVDKFYRISETENGFTESVIAIRQYPNGGGAYLTDCTPTSGKPVLATLAALDTAIIKSDAHIKIESPAAVQEERAAETTASGVSDEEMFDAGDFADLEAAAANYAARTPGM